MKCLFLFYTHTPVWLMSGSEGREKRGHQEAVAGTHCAGDGMTETRMLEVETRRGTQRRDT